ncbi:unnamed protein product [Arctogadus glacialis]
MMAQLHEGPPRAGLSRTTGAETGPCQCWYTVTGLPDWVLPWQEEVNQVPAEKEEVNQAPPEKFAPEVFGPEKAQYFLGCPSRKMVVTRPCQCWYTVTGLPDWVLPWQEEVNQVPAEKFAPEVFGPEKAQYFLGCLSETTIMSAILGSV